MDRAINPYMAGAPLREKSGFFGRQDVLDWVTRELQNPSTNALVLSGQRRIGKTSLLLQMEQFLPSDAFLPVYFDMQGQTSRSLGQLLADLAQAIARRENIEMPAPDNFDNQGRFFLSTFLPQCHKVLGEQRRLVLLLDEFDVLDRAALEAWPETATAKALVPFLHRMMDVDVRVALVLAVGRRAEDLSLDFAATFKAALALQMWVLDRKSAEALVRQAEANGTLRFTGQAVGRILNLTDCHPYFTQLLCQRIWERAYTKKPAAVPKIGVREVEAAVRDALEAGSHALVWLWDGLSAAEKIFLAALAEVAGEDEAISEDKIVQELTSRAALLRIQEVELAPTELVGQGILDALPERKYRFAIELFRRWVNQYRSLQAVKDELDQIVSPAEQIFEVGLNWFRQGEWENAIHLFRDALEQNPSHFRARLYLAEGLLESGQIDEAVTEMGRAYELDRDEARLPLARALIALAKTRQTQGDNDEALAACERALQLSPNEQAAMEIVSTIRNRDRSEKDSNTTITWLHLSDLHFRASQTYNSNIVLQSLLRDISERTSKDQLQPDFVVIAGDIAFSGHPEEYELAAQFLDALLETVGLSKDRLFIVPGNHDVDRAAISPLTAGATTVLSNRDAVNHFLGNDTDRVLVFQRFHNYQDFIKQYFDNGQLTFDSEHYSYVKQMRIARQRVAVLGLNSAWLCGSDQDRNRLLLGERQVRSALEVARDADLRIAVIHHPFDWLQDFDRDDVEPLLRQQCDFVLHGHMHLVSQLLTITPESTTMVVAAGACYETRHSPNSYNFVRLDLGSNTGTLHLRTYVEMQGGFWTRDVVNYSNVTDGIFTFPLSTHWNQARLPQEPDLESKVSPYVFGRPVQPDEFVNRETELRTIFNRLRNGESSVIVGDPHMGKTSLLLKLADEKTRQSYLGDGAANLLISILNLHHIGSDYGPTEFWAEALRPLNNDPDDEAVSNIFGKAARARYSRRSLEQVFTALSQKNLRLALLLDEFELLLSHPNFQHPVFFALLRSLASSSSLSIVVSSRLSIEEVNERTKEFSGAGSPLFNFLIEIRLAPFDDEAVDILLDRGSELFSLDDRSFIRQMAGRHPFLLQAMAATLVETGGDNAHIRAAESFYERVVFHFDDLWHSMDDRARTTMVLLSLVELGGQRLVQSHCYGEIVQSPAWGAGLGKLAARGLAERVEQDGANDTGHLFVWRGERWRIGMQALAWWVRDVVCIRSRQLKGYDEWLSSKGFSSLLTQQQWDSLVDTLHETPIARSEDQSDGNLILYYMSLTCANSVVDIGYVVRATLRISRHSLGDSGVALTSSGKQVFLQLFADGLAMQGERIQALAIPSDETEETIREIECIALRPGSFHLTASATDAQTRTMKTVGATIAVRRGGYAKLPELPNPLGSRPGRQPDFVSRVYVAPPDETGNRFRFSYIAFSPLPRLRKSLGAVGSMDVTPSQLGQIREQLAQVTSEVGIALPTAAKARLSTLGKSLYQILFPPDLRELYHSVIAPNIQSWLILCEFEPWIPWELVKPFDDSGEDDFLGARFALTRAIEGLGTPSQYEFPLGPVSLTLDGRLGQHYQPREWEELFTSGIVPPSAAPLMHKVGQGYAVAMEYSSPVWGQHFESLPDNLARGITALAAGDSHPFLSERSVQDAVFSFWGKRPLVTFGMVTLGRQSALTEMERVWVPTFVKAGVGSFVGSLWATHPQADRLFWSAFYGAIWQRKPLGEAVLVGRRYVRDAMPDSIDWLAYFAVGDPMARGYVPQTSQGYATLECSHDLEKPMHIGQVYDFHASLANVPPPSYHGHRHRIESTSVQSPRLMIFAPEFDIEPNKVLPLEQQGSEFWQTFRLRPRTPGRRDLFFKFLDSDQVLQTLDLTVEVEGGRS